MQAPTRRARGIAALAVTPLAILVAGALVWQGSTAAFTAKTRNAGNSWSSGQVVLTDDDQGRAGFTVTNLIPGDTGQRCIRVTSESNVAGEVRAYVENLATSARGLEDYIFLQVQQGTGGSFESCDGFTPTPGALPAQPLSTLARVNTDYASGGARWQTSGTAGESRVYRGTWRFDTTGLTQAQVDALQGSQVSIDLVWELQTPETPTP